MTVKQRRYDVFWGNDANAVYEYDIANRLLKLTNNIDDGNSIIFDYNDYDKVGNRLSCKIDDANAHIYAYDNLYQLISVDYNDGNSTDYYYDSLGNRTEVDDGTSIIYDSNCLNQYTAVGPQGSQTSYYYDKNGNLTDDGTYLYYYDCENRLIDVNDVNDAAVATYSYDYLGRRVEKVVYDANGQILTTNHYTYDGDQVIAEYDVNNTLLRKFVYGPGIDEPIMMIAVNGETETRYYYHFDGLGSVVALSGENGSIVETYSYDVFGEPTIYDVNDQILNTSAYNNPYMFTGRRYDGKTGLYYYRARYYDPYIGRFLQTDPICYAAGLNLYTYCGNNPLNWLDPYGLLGQHYDAHQTRLIMNRAKYTLNPLAHTVSSEAGGLDYKYSRDTFDVPLITGGTYMRDSEFGNMLAGYRNSYNYGPVGTLGAYGFGFGFSIAEEWGGDPLTAVPVGIYTEIMDGSFWDITRGVLQGYAEVGIDIYETAEAIDDLIKQKMKELWEDVTNWWEEDCKKSS